MATLFSDFVTHYTSTVNTSNLRRHFMKSWNGINKKDEVNAIENYLLTPGVGVDYMNTHVAPAASNTDFVVKFASIFCHKKPKVTPVGQPSPALPGQTVGCELGDLFVMFVLMDGVDNVHHARGALFQAKKVPKLDKPTQEFLYDKAESMGVPSYLENRKGSPAGVRKLPTYENGRAHGFRYLILNGAHQEVGLHFSPWRKTCWTLWATFMDGLLSGTTGMPADVNNPSSEWDHIVADLIEMVQYTKGQKKAERGNSVIAKIASSCFNNYRDRSQWSMPLEERNEGVPTLLVIAHAPKVKPT